MTARGRYLKALVDPDGGRISIRKLAERLAARDDMPNDAEKIRRSLQRHIASDGERDVSERYVTAISAVLEIDPAAWPPATPRQTMAALRQRIAELEDALERARHGDPPAPAQGGEP